MSEKKYMPADLDNAGKIFPAQNTDTWSNVFRVGMELKQKVDPDTLKKALDRTLIRLPGFRVKLKRGTFWYCFEENTESCPVRKDVSNFCYRINLSEDNGFLFRVFYFDRKISLDVYHALCDGYGAVVFLSTLVGEYLRIKGCDVSHNEIVLNVNEKPDAEETEDAYKRYACSRERCSYPSDWVYHRRGAKLKGHLTNYTMATMSFGQLHAISKRYDVTVTELLSAVMLEVNYRKMLAEYKGKKKVCIQIPVNLRKAFPSRSLRNFVLCLRVQLEPRKEEYTFEEILSIVSSQLRSVNKPEILNSMMTKNVKMEKQIAAYAPLGLKNFLVGAGFQITAEKSTTALISNLGPVKLPRDMAEHIEKCFFYTGPGIVNGARCGVTSLGDKLTFTFSSRFKEDDAEREFFSKLATMGVDLSIETNRRAEAVRWAELFNSVDGEAYSRELYTFEGKALIR
ncbi:MAG: hypothetical protein IKJ27_04890 [Clostridia bacterium]|nr:hypothetical protein [Clostridia bacterium]